MSAKNKTSNQHQELAHLTQVIDKNETLLFVQLSAALWKRLYPKWQGDIEEELTRLQESSQPTPSNSNNPVETLHLEDLDNERYICQRFQTPKERSQEVEEYLKALKQKINEHIPAK